MAKRQPNVATLLNRVDRELPVLEGFLAQVKATLQKTKAVAEVVHSYKDRIKSRESVEQKIRVKRKDGVKINEKNLFSKITDLAGIRLLHLFPRDIQVIHQSIEQVVAQRGWVYFEKPKAYSWDPDSVEFLNGLGIRCSVKPSYYTSVHYVVKPNLGAKVCCEIQVRTLFEEIWGEIDHRLKYKTEDDVPESIRDHLGVLARLVGVGARVCDALHHA